MELAKRTEVELKDSLHEAIDRMSLMEIVVLIFLVQMIRTREFVSHVLPKPRKALAEPANDIAEFVEAVKEYNELATACTDPEPETEFSHAEYYEAVMDAIRNNKPYPTVPKFMERIPTEAEWNRMYAEAPPYFLPPPIDWERMNQRQVSAPMPMPAPAYARDAYGRPRVADISGLYPEGVAGYCTPSRNALTRFPCDCYLCANGRPETVVRSSEPVTGFWMDEPSFVPGFASDFIAEIVNET